jgi:lipopolysaccharide heptosyltransferase I
VTFFPGDDRPSRRFLIVRLGSMGDVIHGIPVVAALRARIPEAQIDWAVDPRYVDLLSLVDGVDEAIAVDPRRSTRSLLRTIGALRRRRYEAVLDLQGLIKSAVLARAAGGTRTIGLTRAHLREPLARLFYSRTVDPGAARHVVFKNLALLEPLGIRTSSAAFPLRIPDTAVARDVASRFAGGYALINPGAAWPNKRWPPDRFAAVARALHDRAGLRSLVLWGPGEESLASAVAAGADGAAEMSPPTTIVDLFSICGAARLMVSGDTGPLHIAAAVGTPLVALFGPTLPERNGPWSAADITISRVQTCDCLYERRCRRAVRCIDDIAVDDVIDAVGRRIGIHG